VLIDAGGGTVDAITYTVDKAYPLRLKAEGVEAGGKFITHLIYNVLNKLGALCGSSFLNEAYQAHLHSRLQGEDYLEVNGLTIESIIDAQLFSFENEMKRSVDVVASNTPPEFVFIQGLQANPNPEKRFLNNRVKIEWLAIRKSR
jgi:hypothetical protein